MSGDRRDLPSRWALGALLAVAAFGTAVLVLVSARGEDADRPAAIAPARAGPFRGSQLPAGISNKPAPAFRLADARGGRLGSNELRGSPYVVTFLYTERAVGDGTHPVRADRVAG